MCGFGNVTKSSAPVSVETSFALPGGACIYHPNSYHLSPSTWRRPSTGPASTMPSAAFRARCKTTPDCSTNGRAGASGVAGPRDVTGNSGKEVGSELDLTVLWKINNHSSMLVGYSHFWNDGFVSDTVFSDDDSDFYYVQYQYKF